MVAPLSAADFKVVLNTVLSMQNSESNWSAIGDASVKFEKSVEEYAALVETSDELRATANNVKTFLLALNCC